MDALRRALRDLKPRIWEDRPQAPVRDFPGQQLGRERLRDQLSAEALDDSDWILATIAGRTSGKGWSRGANYHRRFWIAERLKWAIENADDGSGTEWLERWVVTEWETNGWRTVTEELVEDAVRDEAHARADWERDHY